MLKNSLAKAPELSSGGDHKSLHLLLAELENDKRVLKGFNRIEDKVKHKREELVPKYRAAIEEYLEDEETFDNPLFAQMIIWLFDIGEIDTAIEWCDKAIELGVDSPLNRDFATFCADQILEWSHKMANTGHSIEPYFEQIFEKVRVTWRLNEQLTAKYFKFAGLFLLRDKDGRPTASSVGDVETLEKSLALLTEAGKISAKAQVQTVINKIEQRIRALKDNVNL